MKLQSYLEKKEEKATFWFSFFSVGIEFQKVVNTVHK